MALQHPIITASAKYPKPTEHTFQYGTAGVRSKATPKISNDLANLVII